MSSYEDETGVKLIIIINWQMVRFMAFNQRTQLGYIFYINWIVATLRL